MIGEGVEEGGFHPVEMVDDGRLSCMTEGEGEHRISNIDIEYRTASARQSVIGDGYLGYDTIYQTRLMVVAQNQNELEHR